MISLFSLQEPGDKPRAKYIFNYKKPVFWISLTSVVLIITAVVIFLPNALKTPAVSELSSNFVSSEIASVTSVSTSPESTVSTDSFNYPKSFVENGKYGAIDDNGEIIVPAQYDYLTRNFYEKDNKVLYVLQNNQWGAITFDNDMNASEPDWSAQIPEDIMVIYTYFTKPVYPVTDFEAKITEMFLHSGSFDFLASETGEISDEQMVVYAAHNMPNYDWENGNTRAEFESVTMKYFGKTLFDYTINDWFEYSRNRSSCSHGLEYWRSA